MVERDRGEKEKSERAVMSDVVGYVFAGLMCKIDWVLDVIEIE